MCTTEIVEHALLDPTHLSWVSIDTSETNACTFNEGNCFDWSWVLDFNGIQSACRSQMDESRSSSTSQLNLNRVQQVTAGNRVEI